MLQRPTCPQCAQRPYAPRNLMTYLPASGSYYCPVCSYGLTEQAKQKNAAYYGNNNNYSSKSIPSNKINYNYNTSSSGYGSNYKSQYSSNNYSHDSDNEYEQNYQSSSNGKKQSPYQLGRLTKQDIDSAKKSGDYTTGQIGWMYKTMNNTDDDSCNKHRHIQKNNRNKGLPYNKKVYKQNNAIVHKYGKASNIP
eukprot:746352_1